MAKKFSKLVGNSRQIYAQSGYKSSAILGHFFSPKHEIADIFRQAGHSFLENFNASHEQIKILNRIIVCRKVALGDHIDFCPNCDHQQNAYNSCRTGIARNAKP